MFKRATIHKVLAIILLSTSPAWAAEQVLIDTNKIVKTQKHAPIGENLNFLMSSDKKWPRKVSMKTRINEMQLSLLRFPYGHLADNYLFTDAPFSDGVEGLTPRVASINETPGRYYWAVDDQGYFKDALDFDEFMTYVAQTSAEPLIMINMLAYNEQDYPGTVVTFEDLISHAKEWVRYANITRGYKIKYWQLGNEVSHHTDKETYMKNYVEMARALKSVDPTIMLGFGEDGSRSWVKEALANDDIAQYIDFISPHQYLFNTNWTQGYPDWRDYSGTLTPKIDKLQRFADTSKHHQDVPMLVTEYGITGGNYPESNPQGPVFFQMPEKVSKNSSLLGLSNDGKQLVKLPQNEKNVAKTQSIEVELFDDAYMGLKLANSHYITAGSNVNEPLGIKGSTQNDSAKWRLLKADKQQFYLESKLHPQHYVSYDKDKKQFTLAANEPEVAQKFSLSKYKQEPELAFEQKLLIAAQVNKKLLCVQSDHRISANQYRSMSASCQFVLKPTTEIYGKNAVILHSLHNSAGMVTRNADGTVGYSAAKDVTQNNIWILHKDNSTFQFQVYGDVADYLLLDKDNLLSLGGSKSQPATRFSSMEIPEANPQPPLIKPTGNFANDLWKSLVFAEMSLSASLYKNVSHMVHWNTHTSWSGKFGGYHDAANSLENSQENEPTPIGQVIKLINTHTLDTILELQEKHNFLRVYASTDGATGDVSIFILNKNDQVETINLSFAHNKPLKDYQLWVYTGQGPEDEYPAVQLKDDGKKGLITFSGNDLQTRLAPISLTVIHLTAAN